MKDAVAMVLAGGAFSSLGILAERRAKAAIPFGGMYRIIDFVLSNLMNSDIERVGILAQYKPASLIDHVGVGASWDLFGRTRAVKILPPYKGKDASDWYKGTADAVYQNLNFIRDYHPKYVLVLAGENVYSMNYQQIIQFHQEKNAECTLACIKLPAPNPHRFGIMTLDDDFRVCDYQEKPAVISGDYFSAGIYVFNTDFLIDKLLKDAACRKSKHNFADDIIADMLAKEERFYGYPFEGYWAYCGTVEEYWQANMDLLGDPPKVNLWEWNVRTNLDDRNVSGHQPALLLDNAHIQQSIISSGCSVEGTVERSILSPGVVVEAGAVVRDSIIAHESVIRAGAVVDRIVSDKDVVIGTDSRIGTGENTTPNEQYPKDFNSGITVLGKEAYIGDKVEIGRNCLIFPGVSIAQGTVVPSGRTMN